MGSLYKGTCFPTALQAAQSACSDSSSIQSDADGMYHTGCATVDPDDVVEASPSAPGQLYFSVSSTATRYSGGAVSTNQQEFTSAPYCTFDGGVSMTADYFGAVLALSVTVLVAAKLKNYFWRNHESI